MFLLKQKINPYVAVVVVLAIALVFTLLIVSTVGKAAF
jgi:hypothetical protein